jgi:hypothetical protein
MTQLEAQRCARRCVEGAKEVTNQKIEAMVAHGIQPDQNTIDREYEEALVPIITASLIEK